MLFNLGKSCFLKCMAVNVSLNTVSLLLLLNSLLIYMEKYLRTAVKSGVPSS